jgi:hypothetical protein
MMTAKEEAKELTGKMQLNSGCQDGAWMDKDLAKQLALICINEKRKALLDFVNKTVGQRNDVFIKAYDYLIDVKKEIELL